MEFCIASMSMGCLKISGCRINGTYFGVFGYSDDTFLLAPNLEGLQERLKICETYAMKHNLRFSTDPNQRKCKTKCLGFLKEFILETISKTNMMA